MKCKRKGYNNDLTDILKDDFSEIIIIYTWKLK